nr:hypothetical protein [Rothia nasimurium]
MTGLAVARERLESRVAPAKGSYRARQAQSQHDLPVDVVEPPVADARGESGAEFCHMNNCGRAGWVHRGEGEEQGG